MKSVLRFVVAIKVGQFRKCFSTKEIVVNYLDEVDTLEDVDSDDDVDTELEVETLKF